jgi:hypothetical protein
MLANLVVIAAAVVIPIAAWIIIYCAIRILVQANIRSELGDMPSPDELTSRYERMNAEKVRYVGRDLREVS